MAMNNCPPLEGETVEALAWEIAARLQGNDIWHGHGFAEALDESTALLAHILGAGLQLSDEHLPMALGPRQRQRLEQLLERRLVQRVPLAYLVGEVRFAGLSFVVDERVIIPRSPIAELLEAGFAPWVEPARVGAVLDLCTGSGCIAIAAASYLPQATVLATDLSNDALAVARRNVARHGVADRVSLARGDLWQAVPADARFDVIVSNPPYVDPARSRELPAEYGHEPHQALYCDDEGLALGAEIVRQAARFLNPGGILVLEMGESADALQEAFPALPLTSLAFERGGSGVLLAYAADLVAAKTTPG